MSELKKMKIGWKLQSDYPMRFRPKFSITSGFSDLIFIRFLFFRVQMAGFKCNFSTEEPYFYFLFSFLWTGFLLVFYPIIGNLATNPPKETRAVAVLVNWRRDSMTMARPRGAHSKYNVGCNRFWLSGHQTGSNRRYQKCDFKPWVINVSPPKWT